MMHVNYACIVLLSFLACLSSFNLPQFRSNLNFRRPSALIQRKCAQGRTFKLFAVVGEVEDISPRKDSSIMKTLQREGDFKRSLPIPGDRIEVVYKMFDHSTGELLHDSAQGPKINRLENGIYPVNYTANGTFVEGGVRVIKNARSYNFNMGRGEVLKGWETAIKTMRLGEISSFVMQPEYTFGSKGAPPLVQPNAVLRFIFELVRIRPPWELNYESMNEGDSVKENLAKQIINGDSSFGDAIMRKRKRESPAMEEENYNRNAAHEAQVVEGEILTDGAHQHAGPTAAQRRNLHANPDKHAFSHPPLSQAPQQLSQPLPVTRTGTESNAERVYFDPDKHALDPTTEVDGEAEGHYRWTESLTSMDIELPLRGSEGQYVHKSDLLVDIRASTIDVRFSNGTIILAGPLQGKINPHEVTWALNDYNIQDQYKNHAAQFLQISMEKTALYRDIWGTVLSRDYLSSLLTPEERARRRAELENAPSAAMHSVKGKQLSVAPAVSSAPVLRATAPSLVTHMEGYAEEEVLSYIDFDMDEHGRVIGTSTGTGRGEEP